LLSPGLGRCVGTAVQGQVTSNVKGDLGKADTAKGVLRDKIVEYKDAAQKGHLQRQTDGGALKDVLEIALAENPTTYATDDARKVRVDPAERIGIWIAGGCRAGSGPNPRAGGSDS